MVHRPVVHAGVSSADEFRISGNASIVGPEPVAQNLPPLAALQWPDERRRIYSSLSLPMQGSFLGASPGTQEPDADIPIVGGIPTRYVLTNSFSLVAIVPTAVDAVNLHTGEREIHTLESGEWHTRSVNP